MGGEAGRVGLLVALALAPEPARADWAVNGNPLTQAPLAQNAPVLIPDGAGGATAVWLDSRTGHVNVFGQRITATGLRVPGWAPNGDSLTYVPCTRVAVQGISDGAGGVLLAWSEFRCATHQDIYAKRITASGGTAPGWPEWGVPICVAQSNQVSPVITPDGTGGAFIAWADYRDSTASVYVQRVGGDGSIMPGWPSDGLEVCSASPWQFAPAIAADGAGGAFIAWLDTRAGYHIYMQRVTAGGAIAAGWDPAGLAVCTAPGDQRAAALTADASGDVFVAWTDRRVGNYDVYAQRMTGAGVVAPGWATNGVPVCTAPGDQQGMTLAPDGAGGILLAWQDLRSGNLDIFGSRLGGSAVLAPGWVPDGTPLCRAVGNQSSPQIVSDAQGGAIVAWADERSGGSHIYGQHLGPSGAPYPQWPTDGLVLCMADGVQGSPRIVSDEAGGAIVAWTDDRSCISTDNDIYALRVSPEGPLVAGVRDLSALHHTGQTFLTWTCPTGTGWTYRIYSSSQPLTTSSDLGSATHEGAIHDSTWCDRRLKVLTGTEYGYAIDSLASPLSAAKALFVVTPATSGSRFYAVTAELGSCSENRSVVTGVNSLAIPVQEWAAAPEPVYQRTLSVTVDRVADLYTLWTTDRATPGFPAMANRPAMAFDCAVVRGGSAPRNPLLLSLHARGSDLLGSARTATGYPGEWVLALDDPVETGDGNTFWYGYHENYAPGLWFNPVPQSGTVRDYTMQRVIHTLLWARRHFPIDTTRVVGFGISMGGIGDELLALRRPDLIAGVMTLVAKFDFSFLDDPNPLSGFNTGNGLRASADRLWGQVSTDLPTSEGCSAFQALNDGWFVGTLRSVAAPPLIAFNGKNDITVGWAEKIPFYRAMRDARQGGMFFWDTREHGNNTAAAWTPMQDPQYPYRFRTNLSFPALSNCSIDHDPGDGHVESGDSVGCINAYVEWDTVFVDQPHVWQTTLRLRDLTLLGGLAPAPESLTVDVTPRRLQAFRVGRDSLFGFTVRRLTDGALVQSGVIASDEVPLLTVPGVKVYRGGSRLSIEVLGIVVAADEPNEPRPGRPLIRLKHNPLRGGSPFDVVWPVADDARLDLYDPAGRLVRRLFAGRAEAGSVSMRIEPEKLAAGIYFLVARQRDMNAVKRVVVLR